MKNNNKPKEVSPKKLNNDHIIESKLENCIEIGKSSYFEIKKNEKARLMLLQFDRLIRDNLIVIKPNFEQKFCISYQFGRYKWIVMQAFADILLLQIFIKVSSMDTLKIAKQLGILEYDANKTLSEKFNQPSSVNIKITNETSDRILLRIKDDFDMTKPEFLDFLKETLKCISKS